MLSIASAILRRFGRTTLTGGDTTGESVVTVSVTVAVAVPTLAGLTLLAAGSSVSALVSSGPTAVTVGDVTLLSDSATQHYVTSYILTADDG